MIRLRRSALVAAWLLWSLLATSAFADGKLVRPRDYSGSLEEKAQEAIIIFHGSETPGQATEDLILKIRVSGDINHFAWVVPLPNAPTTAPEDAQLFTELFRYVELRTAHYGNAKSADKSPEAKAEAPAKPAPVEVISRKIVGSYDVAVVRENESGKLNAWLEQEGYQPLAGAEDVLEFYRAKKYVYACVKVSQAELQKGIDADLHPLRFTFQTGGRDGIYFPMKLTGLQSEPFDVNLYVFYRFWLNDKLSKFGYTHRGFSLRYRDWDSPQCEPDGGKGYSNPAEDPFLRGYETQLTQVASLLQKLHPGERYYLTNVQATGLKPADVRAWSDDLWLFPYYTDTSFIPYDVQNDGPASTAWPMSSEKLVCGMPVLAYVIPTFAAVGLALVLLLAYFVRLHLRHN